MFFCLLVEITNIATELRDIIDFLQGNHFGTRELEEMGKNFCVGLLKLSQSYSVKVKREHFSEPSFYTCERDDETGDITDER